MIRRMGEVVRDLQDRTEGAARWAALLLPPLVLAAWVRLVLDTGRWPAGDGPHVLGTAMRLGQQLRDLALGDFLWCLNSLLGPHPPGAYLPALASYTVLGTSWRGAHLVAGALVLWLCWDGIRRLGGGWVGAVFLGASGLVWLQAESYGVDLVGAAVVVQCLSWLVASEGLSRPRESAAWGAWLGLAFLTKYTAPLALWAPCLVAGAWVIRGGRWRNLGRAVLAWALVAGPWLFPHLGALRGYLGASSDADNALLTNKALVAGAWHDAENLSWYPAALVDAFGWPGVLALLVGVLAWPRRRHAPPGAWVVPLTGALGAWLLLAMQIQRQDRYLLVIFPLLAALAGSSRLRWLLAPVGAAGLYGAAAVYATWTDVPASRTYTHDLSEAGEDWPWVHEAYQPTSFDPELWRLDELLGATREVHGSEEGTVGFLLDDMGGAPGFGNVLSRVAAQGYRWHVATVMVGQGGRAAVFVGPFTTDAWPSRDFSTLLAIVRPTDGQRTRWLQSTGMTLVEEWSLPQGRVGRLYRTPDGEPLQVLGGGERGGGAVPAGTVLPDTMPPDTRGGGPP